MFWFWPRILVILFVCSVSGVAGAKVGALWRLESFGAGFGASVGAALVVFWDVVLASRLLNWLSLGGTGAAPSTFGIWSELGVRVERQIKLRDLQIEKENARLQSFLAAIEASPNGVVLLNSAEQVLWCNQTAAVHLGLDPVRDKLQRITNLVRAPAFVRHLHAPETSSTPVVISSGTSRRHLLAVQLCSYGNDGQRLMLTQDITERERTEAMRRDFVANVSHEIRTPLTVLSGFIETLQLVPSSQDDLNRILGLMGQQSQRMLNLVGDLLALSRLEGNPPPAIDEWHLLSEIGERVAADARLLSAGRHLLKFQWIPCIEISGSEGELVSALSNLLTNAVRYTPAGGEISVQAELSLGGLQVQVCDTGPGIAAQHLPRLTERFYRVDGSRSRETGGTGLGLAIVKHVMLRHGGELLVQSELGKGSQFVLSFPLSRIRMMDS